MAKTNTENKEELNQLKKLQYDENGLVIGIKYEFNEDGGVDWKKMIPPKFLYVNNDPKNRAKLEKKYGKTYEEIDPIKDNVEDIDLIQTLGAAKFLLRLKGFTDIKYSIKEANENYAAVNCRIVFRGNYESLGEPIPFEDNACATPNNTNGFGQKYLLEMATNRAFVRCVRNACNIAIVNKEEIFGGLSENDSNNSPSTNIDSQVSALIDKIQGEMNKRNVTFEQLKNVILVGKDKIEGAENFKSLRDIPKDKLFNLHDRIKNAPVKAKEQ